MIFAAKKRGADGGRDFGLIVAQWFWSIVGCGRVAAAGFP